MNSKTTAIWFVLAAALFAFLWIYERQFQPPPPGHPNLFPGLRPADVTEIQVVPAGAKEISVRGLNPVWQLDKPVAYPAQPAAIQSLLTALEKLAPALRLSADDLRGHKSIDTEFGFDAPQFSLIVATAAQRWQLQVGNRTAPGDQVFLRMVGVDGVFVAPVDWLRWLPHSVDEWRDTALVPASAACDWIVITNGGKVLELRRESANPSWRMIRPLPARANGPRIAAALQQLRSAQVTQFVTDDPQADLGAYGLQPAELEVWLGRGTNAFSTIHAGKETPDNAARVFARRDGYNTVVTVAKSELAAWRGSVNDFRDPFLLDLTAPVAEIELSGENHFVLQQSRSNTWSVAGEMFPADADSVQALLKLLGGFRISEFVKDVVTPADLQGFGLDAPDRQITLRTVEGETNRLLARLLFGRGTNQVFVKRADEEFVYALPAAELKRLPENGWEFRDRQIWRFSETNVIQVTLHQGGKTRQLIRNALNSWSLAPGSQGIINPPAIEETLHRLGELTAAGWVGRNVNAPEKYGLNPENLSLTVELKTGEKYTLDFGMELPSQTALAAVTLNQERWVFVLSPALYHFVAGYLTIPANAP